MGRACSKHGEKRNAYRILMGKSGGKRPLGRRRRWCGIKRLKLSLCHEDVWGSGCIDPRILDLDISWR
jgi:hypothetical protein